MPAVTVQQAFDLALQHHRAGRLAEAEALYRQILAVQPQHGDALHFLGVIAHQSGHHAQAVELVRQAIALHPGNPAAYTNLGEIYRALGRLPEAVAAFRQALTLKPDDPLVHYNLGNALKDAGQWDQALAAYRRALVLKPDYPEAHLEMGILLRRLGRIDEAVAAYQDALRERPEWADAHNNLGNALRELGKLDEAVAAYGRAIALKPNYPEACNNLGVTLFERGQAVEAIAAYQRAIELRPDQPDAYLNLGNAFLMGGDLDRALAAYHRALELRPNDPEAPINLGCALREMGNLDEAIATFRRALQLNPDQPSAHSNLIYTLHFTPGAEESTIAVERQRWNQRFGEPWRRSDPTHANDRDPARRLRIGYVSPDFRDHVIGRNLRPLFHHHDRGNFEILCYSGVVRPDRLTAEFRQAASQWRPTLGVPDEALAEMIRQDQVDILVDLAQHMAGNRLLLFARQPAPVQVSFAGYPESTGLPAIPYRLSDRYLELSGRAGVPTGQGGAEIPREQVLLLDSFWCYDPCGVEIEVNRLPAQATGTITFGSLNNFSKLNDPVLQLWARVLHSVPDSRLILLGAAGSHRRRTVEFLGQSGIAAARIEFVESRPRRDYLELYHRLDIALDPFPYNGHTTSLDALWMGVPVVSLAGRQPMARAGLSQLTNLGLPELIAHSGDEYVTIATQLAHDLPRLAGLRATLRPRMESSVLMDAAHFARQIEAAYRTMWNHWCESGGA